MLAMVKKFLKSERGMETVEYAVIAALMVSGAIVALTALGGTLKDTFDALNTVISV